MTQAWRQIDIEFIVQQRGVNDHCFTFSKETRTMKRKHESENGHANGVSKKVQRSESSVKERFSSDIFSPKTVASYKKSYAESEPYDLHTLRMTVLCIDY